MKFRLRKIKFYEKCGISYDRGKKYCTFKYLLENFGPPRKRRNFDHRHRLPLNTTKFDITPCRVNFNTIPVTSSVSNDIFDSALITISSETFSTVETYNLSSTKLTLKRWNTILGRRNVWNKTSYQGDTSKIRYIIARNKSDLSSVTILISGRWVSSSKSNFT